ncbi:PRKR-interacting protein 1, partial [Tremellales sp. Uapishka_1]
MPYVQTDSPSPPRPEFAPIHQDVPSGSGVKKPKTTMAEIQRRQLEKLLENPEKEVQLPVGFQEKTLRAPREMMKNVQGSSAGAGSGEFHVYKQSRRREYDRIKIMNDNSRALEEQAEFQKRQAERDAAADAKTAKNRQKRLKRKGGGKKGTEG